MNKHVMLKEIKTFTQYDVALSKLGKGSACGPTTIATLLNDSNPTTLTESSYIRQCYKQSGTTWLGLPAWQLVFTLRKYGKSEKIAVNCMWDHFTKEIDQNRAVAIKFDQWSSFKWSSRNFHYRYHWVTGIGYEVEEEKRYLHVLDNGAYDPLTKQTRESKVERISFDVNKSILTMVTFSPN
ncbi:C39 family peptidase [Jeotgalibacillus marinus]|uniref:C39 family peptidase n=1 Tax=Jeotgalibacillus marinus TaxID=86667 RepID=A0ABV3Q6P5_9BACL